MANISPINSSLNPYQNDLNKKILSEENEKVYEAIGLDIKAKNKEQEKSQVGDFMKLFIEQLKHQDPLNPAEGADFIAQIAQFNTVENLAKVEKEVRNMADSFKASRILESTGMIGKSIEVPTNQMQLVSENGDISNKKPVKGFIQAPDPLGINDQISAMVVTITNSNTGELVQQYDMGPQLPGSKVPFEWNAKNKDGSLLKVNGQDILDGQYTLDVRTLHGREWYQAKTVLGTMVDSVSIGEDGDINLNTSTVGAVKLSDIKRVG